MELLVSLPESVQDIFVANGFTLLEGGLYKRVPVIQMPYMKEHVIDGELVFDSDVAVFRVNPDATLEMTVVDKALSDSNPDDQKLLAINDPQYREDLTHLSSADAFGLLQDAGLPAKEIQDLL